MRTDGGVEQFVRIVEDVPVVSKLIGTSVADHAREENLAYVRDGEAAGEPGVPRVNEDLWIHCLGDRFVIGWEFPSAS